MKITLPKTPKAALWLLCFGFIGQVISAITALPQVLKVVEQGHAEGLSLFFILFYMGGRLVTSTYAILRYGPDIFFISSTVLIILFNSILVYYILFLT